VKVLETEVLGKPERKWRLMRGENRKKIGAFLVAAVKKNV
jgi:hypothetical protein